MCFTISPRVPIQRGKVLQLGWLVVRAALSLIPTDLQYRCSLQCSFIWLRGRGRGYFQKSWFSWIFLASSKIWNPKIPRGWGGYFSEKQHFSCSSGSPFSLGSPGSPRSLGTPCSPGSPAPKVPLALYHLLIKNPSN